MSDIDGTETREQHHTHKSITLDFPDPNNPTTLQSLIDHCHNGGTYLQACTHPPRVLLLRLSRFQDSEAHGTIKLHTRVDIPTSVHVPCYSDPRHGEDCRSIPYLVVACVLHCDATVHAGHYTTRYINHLPSRTAPHAPPQWRADDSKPIEHIRTSVPHDSILGQQSYLVLLCRSTQCAAGVAACGGRTSSLCSKKLQKTQKKFAHSCQRLRLPHPLPTLINACTLTQVLLWRLLTYCADGHSDPA